MNKDLKKNIKLLADKFNLVLEYDKDTLLLKNEINKIRIWEKDKHGINISFNLNGNIEEILKLSTEDIYDILLELFKRKSSEEIIEVKTGILLTVEEWINEEGKFAKKQLEELKRDLQYELIDYRNLGGNRFEAEFFKGVLILMDDLCWAKSNVISI